MLSKAWFDLDLLLDFLIIDLCALKVTGEKAFVFKILFLLLYDFKVMTVLRPTRIRMD